MFQLFANLKILVLEDDLLSGELLRHILGDRGASVTHVTDLETAFAAARSEPPHVMIVDYRLRNGVTSETLIEWLDSTTIPYVVASGSVQFDLQHRLRSDCTTLSKPYDTEQLIEAIRRALEMTALARIASQNR